MDAVRILMPIDRAHQIAMATSAARAADPVSPPGLAALVLSPHAVRVAHEERADAVLDAEVNHFAGALVREDCARAARNGGRPCSWHAATSSGVLTFMLKLYHNEVRCRYQQRKGQGI